MRRLPLLFFVLATACRPDFGERASFVDRPEILAVLVDPPEARPGEAVTASLVVASPDGPLAAPLAVWAFCATPKLLTENGSVSPECLQAGVTEIPGAGPSVTAALPSSSCALFGPDITSADLRPRDPDVTGGYFAPIRAVIPALGDVRGFGFARVTCNLANAGAEQATQLAAQYRANVAPVLQPLAGADFAEVRAGTTVRLVASWTAADAETYAYFDPTTPLVTTKRESLRVSWFTTAGSFAEDRTGRTETDLATSTENAWTAPAAAGPVHLWAILRDSRGGATARYQLVTVR